MNAWPPSAALNSCLCALVMVWLVRPYPINTLLDGILPSLQADRDPPAVIGTHSTCGMVVSVAFFTGVSVKDIYGSHMFYTLPVQSVLSLGLLGSFLGSVLTRTTQDW